MKDGSSKTQFKKGMTPWNKGTLRMKSFKCATCKKVKQLPDWRTYSSVRYCSRKCIVPWNKGVPMVEEIRKKMIGRKLTSEHRKAISIAHKGLTSSYGMLG